jgi:predicted amidohydrolase/GNAT superfamily N-acetyltransferase
MMNPPPNPSPSSSAIRIRQANVEDIPGILEVARLAYPSWTTQELATERNYQLQIAAFPEGQFVALIDDKIVGYASSLIVQLLDESIWYAHGEITGWGTFSTHTPSGNTLYGADIAVMPAYQKRGISKKLYQARKALLKRFNLKEMIAGGRIPGYSRYQGKISAKEYVRRAVAGEIQDPTIKAHLRAGYEIRGVHYGYIQDDQSLGYATHLVMKNPRYRPSRRMLAAQPVTTPARKMRICAVQYEMRKIANWDDFCEQVEYFVETADGYNAHILILPELFIAQMLVAFPRGESMPEYVGRLADLHDAYLEFFKKMAIASDMLIVAGSVPVRQADGSIRNVAHLFSATGNVYTQEKLHLTPAESQWWGFSPGEGLKVFHTPVGRIAILICYDVEFPELSRILVDAGVDVIIVPFATDERKAYQRVRYCAQARAVENMVYVALAGNVGALPRSPAMAVNFGQAAILTPSDFAFPLYGIAGEGIANTQTVVVADVDIGSLEIEREIASVRPLVDRRLDLYEVRVKTPVQRVRVT